MRELSFLHGHAFISGHQELGLIVLNASLLSLALPRVVISELASSLTSVTGNQITMQIQQPGGGSQPGECGHFYNEVNCSGWLNVK